MRGTIIYQTTKRRNVVRSGDNYRSLPSLRAPFLGLFAPPRNHRRLPSSHRVARKLLLPCSFVRSRARQRVPRTQPSIHPKSHRRLSVARFRVPAFPREFSKCILTVHDSCRFVPTKKKAKARRASSPDGNHFHFHWTDRPTRLDSLDRPVSMKKSNHERSIRTQKRTNE